MTNRKSEVITEAAVESAALDAGLATHDWEMFEAKVGDVAEAVEVAIRAALEAAAPHMLAGAWDAGESAGQDNAAAYQTGGTVASNPFRPTN